MLRESYPYYLANTPEAPNCDLEVVDKYTGEVATRVALADAAAIDRAIGLAVAATGPMRELAAFERQAVLQHCVARFSERADELALALCIEAGKPIRDARGEVTRLVDTFRIAAEESVRITGEVLPLDISPRARGYSGMWKRVPIGPLLVHLAVQLPAQPRRPQGGAGSGGGVPLRVEAGQPDAHRRADHRRGPGGDGPASRRVLRASVSAQRCRALYH